MGGHFLWFSNVKLRTYNNSGEKLLTSNKNFMDRKFENFQNRQRTEVWMDVLRDGQIVDLNVYLGERLSLSIMTNINDGDLILHYLNRY